MTRSAVVAVLVLLASGRTLGHHNFLSEFDPERPLKVTGTVTKLEWTNPHTWFYMDVKDDAGQVINWGMEMGSPNALMRAGWTRNALKIGEVVTVEGFHARDKAQIGNARVVVLRQHGTTVVRRVECGTVGGGDDSLQIADVVCSACAVLLSTPAARRVSGRIIRRKEYPEPRTESRTCRRHSPEQPMDGPISPASGPRRPIQRASQEGLKELSFHDIKSTSFEM